MSLGLVLVIDDDEWVGRLLAVALRESGYEVMICASAVEGYEKAVEAHPDCIICDVDLPDVDGFWVARKIRMDPSRVSVTPFLFLSGLDDRDTRIQGFHVGADVYMTKPFRIDEVVAQVGALVQMVSRLRQSRSSFLSVPPSDAAMVGDLAQMSIATVLTLLDMERRSGNLEISNKTDKALLDIVSGAIASATLNGEKRDPLELLRALLTWNVGRFAFRPDEAEMAAAQDQSINALLMEAVRLEDETRASLLDPVEMGGPPSPSAGPSSPRRPRFTGLSGPPPDPAASGEATRISSALAGASSFPPGAQSPGAPAGIRQKSSGAWPAVNPTAVAAAAAVTTASTPTGGAPPSLDPPTQVMPAPAAAAGPAASGPEQALLAAAAQPVALMDRVSPTPAVPPPPAAPNPPALAAPPIAGASIAATPPANATPPTAVSAVAPTTGAVRSSTATPLPTPLRAPSTGTPLPSPKVNSLADRAPPLRPSGERKAVVAPTLASASSTQLPAIAKLKTPARSLSPVTSTAVRPATPSPAPPPAPKSEEDAESGWSDPPPAPDASSEETVAAPKPTLAIPRPGLAGGQAGAPAAPARSASPGHVPAVRSATPPNPRVGQGSGED